MQDFGKRLAALIDGLQLEHVDIARKALGKKSPLKQRKAFANYISRMRQGRVPSPGLQKLEQLATGMGLSLTDFFARLEQPDLHNPSQTNTDSTGRIRSDKKQGSVNAGANPAVSEHDDDVNLAQLSRACLEAAERTNRGVIRRLLAELAYAFGVAADSTPEGQQRLVHTINTRIG